MKPKKSTRILSFLLIFCMVFSLLPTWSAAEEADAGAAEQAVTEDAQQKDGQQIVYSDVAIAFEPTDAKMAETSGKKTVTLRRDGNVGFAMDATILVYDNNANYGEDYLIHYNGAVVSKIEGSRSIYDAFRDEGALSEGWVLADELRQSTDDDEETVVDIEASEMLAELDELNALAARIPVTFAAGESTLSLTIEVLDDAISEYEESFLLAVLDEEGRLAEGGQLLLAIEDNEAAPTVTVAFDCETKIVADSDTGLAALTFCRVGDLATSTTALLLADGEVLGYVDFSPYQDAQVVYVEEGTYTLEPGVGYGVIDESVTVVSTDGSVTVAPGGDAELDAVPDSYATMPSEKTRKDEWTFPDWFPDWARYYSNQETDTYIAYLGTRTSSKFVANHVDGVGSYKLLYEGGSQHLLDTSGTFSRRKTGDVNVRSAFSYDMTGIESIETSGYVWGLDRNNKLIISLHSRDKDAYDRHVVGSGETYNSKNKTTITAKYYLPDKYQSSGWVHVENNDPTEKDDGCGMIVPNGFKANKRTYRFLVVTPDPLSYRGYGEKINIQIQNGSSDIFRRMGDNVTVPIAYKVDGQLPVTLVGYKLRNPSTLATSDVIKLSGNSLTFNRSFLKSYENTYCANTQNNADGKTYSTFEIIPVFEKVPLTLELEDSIYGTISIRGCNQNTQFYKGEKIVIEGKANGGAAYYGVYFKNYKNLSSGDFVSGTMDVSSSGVVSLELGNYEKIVLQGAFRTDPNQLSVNYKETDANKRHGKLGFTDGIVLDKDAYVKGDYFPLVAVPEKGYVTRWNSDGRVYYGNTFYYQLDGNSNHNYITVEFVPESSLTMTTGTVSGVLYVYDVTLNNGGESKAVLADKMYSVSSDDEYEGYTDENGIYTIENFKGVAGGTYSMMAIYRGMVGYVNFVPLSSGGGTSKVDVTMPQFAYGSVYPSEVTIKLNDVTPGQNLIQLRETDTGSITVRVTNEAKGAISKVTLKFLSRRTADYGAELKSFEMKYNKELTEQNDSALYSYWTMEITNTGDLPERSQMYVVVEGEKDFVSAERTYDSEGNVTGTSISKIRMPVESGLVNSGYEFISAITDDSVPVEQSIPDIPGAQNAYSADTEALSIPIIGSADFSITSATGGYFVQKVQNDTTYLICGYSITPVYGSFNTLRAKYDAANQTEQMISSMKADGEQQVGSASTTNIILGEGNTGGAGTVKPQTKQKKASSWSIYPAFMFKFVLTTQKDEDGVAKNYLTGFEMALGFDSYTLKNVPFSIYGVPFYICFTLQIEAFGLGQVGIEPGTVELGSSVTMMLYDMCKLPTDQEDGPITEANFFLSAPKLLVGLKAGAGYNSFLGLYVNGKVEVPVMFQFKPQFDVGGQLSFDISIGSDLVFFSANYDFVSTEREFGSETLKEELRTIQGYSSALKLLNTASAGEDQTSGTTDGTPSMEEVLNNLHFSLMERPACGTDLLRAGRVDSRTLAENVFKNTKVQLVQLENGNIIALFLVDNGADNYNYLSVCYAVSEDQGETWSDIQYVNNNIDQANTALQFDVNVFQLEDRTLITWSEANFDAMLRDLDVNNLTEAQIATLMNAMNLRGRFFNSETGEAMGEAFTIAEHSTVACGALNAVQNGDNVYVYYQRNSFPTEDSTKLTDLLATDRTIAIARANVENADTWISTPVRAMNQDGHQYRITEVQPFVHDGIMGEVLVIDRNGKLAIYDSESEEWTADNEDRQLYLRLYDFAEDGTPEPTALIALSDSEDCAQSPQIVSNDDYLHLFWNENGDVVYISDFVSTDHDNEAVQECSILRKNSDGSITIMEHEAITGTPITGSETLDVGTTFSASMADDGNVLLSWIGNDMEDESLTPADEIYGVILNTVTNAEAHERGGIATEGNEDLYELWAVGAPVALTDEDSLIGALDSICLESGKDSKFLLAFSRLNAERRTDVTAADVLAVQSTDAPKLAVDEISVPDYPIPGTTMEAAVTVSNSGLEPLQGISVTASGVGKTVTVEQDEVINPGEIATVTLEIPVPADFAETAELKIAVSGMGAQADYTASGSATVSYGAYFTVDNMSELSSVPNSRDCEAVTTVKNIGNAAGKPTLTFTNTIYGSDEYELDYVFESDVEVAPGEEVTLTYVLEDTLINREKTANLVVATGDNWNQRADSLMPTPVIDANELAAADTPIEEAFEDVATHWAKEAIAFVYEQGLMNGMSATTFEPETSATRAMLVTVLYRMAGAPETSGTTPFTDVSEDWYTDAVSWAVEKKIVEGYGDGTFGPDDPVTREQMAVIFYRYAANAGFDMTKRAELTDFLDEALISDYAREAMSWATAVGLINGVTPDTLCPMEDSTRAQIAVVLQRFWNLLPERRDEQG